MPRQVVDIQENSVFAGRTKHRRVVRVLGARIYYSDGGDGRPRSCKRPAFLAWIRRDGAEAVDREKENVL